MKFLVALIVVFGYIHWHAPNALHLALSDLLSRRKGNVVGVLVTNVIAPVLLVAWLGFQFSDSMLWLVLSLVTLVFCIATEDGEAALKDHDEWLQSTALDQTMEEIGERQASFERQHVYSAFQAVVPVLFWFLLLGPAAALLYTLLLIFARNEGGNLNPGRVIYLLEWLPAKLTGLLFAFVGNFGPAIDYWLRLLFDVREPIARQLVTIADLSMSSMGQRGGQDIEAFVKLAQHHVRELAGICNRALYGWLGIAAVVVLLGW